MQQLQNLLVAYEQHIECDFNYNKILSEDELDNLINYTTRLQQTAKAMQELYYAIQLYEE